MRPSPSDPIDLLVGARVRARRESLGMSQAKLGARLGVSFQQIQKYERGANRISISALVRIADALLAPPSAFLPDEPGGPALDSLAMDFAQDPGSRPFLEAWRELDHGQRQEILNLVLALAEKSKDRRRRSRHGTPER